MNPLCALFSRERIGLTLVGLAVVVVALALLAPRDATLGDTSPVVYLHGALVWTSILAFSAAGVVGLAVLAIQFFFALLAGGCGLAALQVARWMRRT
jgi:hypothetical protein